MLSSVLEKVLGKSEHLGGILFEWAPFSSLLEDPQKKDLKRSSKVHAPDDLYAFRWILVDPCRAVGGLILKNAGAFFYGR